MPRSNLFHLSWKQNSQIGTWLKAPLTKEKENKEMEKTTKGNFLVQLYQTQTYLWNRLFVKISSQVLAGSCLVFGSGCKCSYNEDGERSKQAFRWLGSCCFPFCLEHKHNCPETHVFSGGTGPSSCVLPPWGHNHTRHHIPWTTAFIKNILP